MTNPSAHRRILVIDDNPAIAGDIRKILEPAHLATPALSAARAGLFGETAAAAPEAPYHLDEAPQGEAGLAKVCSAVGTDRPYAVAFVDMRMPPGWDGVETIEHLWRVDADLQVVICTAFSDLSLEQIHARLGHTDKLLVLKKPFDPMEVSQLAAALTEKHRMLAQSRRQVEELKLAKDAAEEGSRAKSQFVTNMSHELRTPLSVVIGEIDLALLAPASECERSSLLAARMAAMSLLGIIDDLMDLTRVEADEIVLHPAPFVPRELFESVVEKMAWMAMQRGLTLVLDVDESWPPELVGDRSRIQQVLTALVNNAIKFTPRGLIEVRAHGELRGDGAWLLQATVSDPGIGIAATDRERIFERFMQVDGSLTRRHGGLGIGLHLCKELMQRMGGTIRMESVPGQGSAFTIDLPLRAPVPAKAPERKDPGAPSAALRPRVLIVEDNPMNAHVAARMVGTLGCDVVVVGDGLEAVQQIQAESFAFVLMDCQMPVMDGYEATRRIRALGLEKEPAIVALTAHSMPGDRESCLQAGMDDYLSKPIRLGPLEGMLAKWGVRTIASTAGAAPAPAPGPRP